MELSSDLISQFAKVTKPEEKPSEGKIVNGTAVAYEGTIYVRLDGSDQLTPVISSTAGMKSGDRVTVMIKDHSATVTGNTSDPSASSGDLSDTNDIVDQIGNQISEFEIVIADKVSVKEFDAEKARIDDLVAENVTIKDKLTATEADIGELTADNVTINEKLTAAEADIENLEATKISADIADLKYATIENLEATNADIHNLEADYGDFKVLTTGKFEATEADIQDLEVKKLSAEEAELKYANIDFSNIGKAAIEEFFSKSGMISDLVVGEGTITGKLVGVTIVGDLIEGGTVKADKLVVQGSDGLYYKLNVSGETVAAEQTEYNSLNGSIITAKSVTAEKISVKDLVAFGATIGGFHITDSAIYSGVKESVDNTTRGTYLDDEGQFAIGDSKNFLKYYKASDGTYKLEVSAGSIRFGVKGESVEDVVNDVKENAITSSVEEFYLSNSPTSLSEGSWSATQPTWTQGKYIWRRTMITYGDGRTEYSPNQNGVCITGNTGATGADGGDGKGISSITNYYLATSSSSGVTVSTSGWTTTVQSVSSSKKYLWNYEKITYTDNTTSSTDPCIIGAYGDSGSDGSSGKDGVGISNITEYYQVSTSNSTAPTTWQTTVPTLTATNKYLWNYEKIQYTNNNSEETAKRVIGVYGDKGATGATGPQGPAGVGISTVTEYYALSTSTSSVPTSWQTTVPTLTATNKYLWNYEKITKTDGNSIETSKRIIGVYGDKGATGGTGATGNGISSITNYYLTTSAGSGVTTATSGWSTAPTATTTTNKYMWNYEKITYTNGNSINTTPHIIGTHGATGATGPAGVSVSSVDVQYYLSTSSTSLSGGSWSTDAPTWVDGKYMWSKTVTKLSNGTTKESDPVCITGAKGSTGSTGSTGATGTGISSITEEYYLSTSKTTQTGGSWVITPPTWSSGKYMWTRSKIVYTNPASTKYTTPVCDSSWEAVNEVEVGGRNYYSKNTVFDSFNGTVDGVSKKHTVIKDYNDCENGFYMVGVKDGNGTVRFEKVINSNGYWTVSFEIRGSQSVSIHVYVDLCDRGNFYVTTTSDNTWKKIELNFEIDNYTSDEYNFLDFSNMSWAHFYIRNIKVEKGSKATDWTPAPEDMATSDDISNVQDSLDDANDRIDSSEARIDLLNDTIAHLVTDEDGQTLMEQTSTGWRFNIGALQSQVNDTAASVDQVEKDLTTTNSLINKANDLIEDISEKTAYINMATDDSGSPCIELGKSGNPFKLRITNTSIDFMQDSAKIAYITNRQLYIQSSVVTDEMKIGVNGGFIWKKRANGNLGLSWESD